MRRQASYWAKAALRCPLCARPLHHQAVGGFIPGLQLKQPPRGLDGCGVVAGLTVYPRQSAQRFAVKAVEPLPAE